MATNPGSAAMMARMMYGGGRTINPMSYSQEQAMDPRIAYGYSLMRSRGTDDPRQSNKKQISSALRAAGENLLGAYLAGSTAAKYRDLEKQAQSQFADIMRSGNDVDAWEAAYNALPEDQRNEKVGQILGNARTYYALSNADEEPYAGLSGDAKNMAIMQGRMPTWEEYNAYKNPPKLKRGVDEWGNEYTYYEGGSPSRPRSSGGGASLGAVPVSAGANLGAVPASTGIGNGAPVNIGATPLGSAQALGAVPNIPIQQSPAMETPQAQGFYRPGMELTSSFSPLPEGKRFGKKVAWMNPQDETLPDGTRASVQRARNIDGLRILGPASDAAREERDRKKFERDEAEALAKAKAAEQQAAGRTADKTLQASVVLDEIGKAKNAAQDYMLIPNTGIGNSLLGWVPSTTAYDMNRGIETIKANVGFDKLQNMRENSPTGGALGQVSEMENRLLQSVLGNLDSSQSERAFLGNMERLEKIYNDIVNGTGEVFDRSNGTVKLRKGWENRGKGEPAPRGEYSQMSDEEILQALGGM